MSVKKEANVSLHRNELNLVWAQMRFCSYWPARIVSTPPELGRTPAGKICVLFFGTKQFGFVGSDKVKDYLTHREEYAKIGRGTGFDDAVKKMDEYISNPLKFRLNAFAKPINCRIRVKTELGISNQSNAKKTNGEVNVVKVELNAPKQRNEAIPPQKENQALIDKVVSLKTENQQLALQLRSEQLEKASLKSELQNMAHQINTQSAEINILRSKLSEESAKYNGMNAKNDVKISNLTRAKDLLEARNKQLQKGIGQRAVAEKRDEDEDENDDDNVYEVEKLVDHIMEKGVRYYLVHWKGYSKRHDTWEKESNLNCPNILMTYNASVANKKKKSYLK